MSDVTPAHPFAAPADYGRTADPDDRGARVSAVRVDSPAYDAGIEAGMRIMSVNGAPLTDMITWLWESSEESVELAVFDPRDATRATCELERLPGEDWGLEFDGVVFDGMRTCVNACTFCFMRMLPAHMRGTLYIRDDDYRLSFLQGNFVTLTNMSDEDVERVIALQLSPMNVSLHAISPGIRKQLMGRNQARGIEVLERLIAAGIEIHAQIVLVPGVNDGEELAHTLAWCAERPAITSLGIVPLGYTKFQTRFESSYSDDPAAARAVIEQVRPLQREARRRYNRSVYQLADEFYLDAGIEVPSADVYDGYPQYYDGIGMIRSYLDEADEIVATEASRLEHVASVLRTRGLRLQVVSGEAARTTIARFAEAEPLEAKVIAIRNDYFGGNVDVTGLICGCDLLAQLPDALDGVMLFVPDVMFNADGLTLDGYHRNQLEAELASRGAVVRITSTMPSDMLESLEDQLQALAPHA